MTSYLVPALRPDGGLRNRLRQNVDISNMVEAQLQWLFNNRRKTTYNLTQLLARRQAGLLSADGRHDLHMIGEILERRRALQG